MLIETELPKIILAYLHLPILGSTVKLGMLKEEVMGERNVFSHWLLLQY